MRVRVWILALVACLAITSIASAQVQSGNISGSVKDEQGGVLPGVTLTLQGSGAGDDVRDRRRRTVPLPERASRHLHPDGDPSGLPHA